MFCLTRIRGDYQGLTDHVCLTRIRGDYQGLADLVCLTRIRGDYQGLTDLVCFVCCSQVSAIFEIIDLVAMTTR